MDGPPLHVLGIATLVVAAGGWAALSIQCQVGSCGTAPEAYHLAPMPSADGGFTYAAALQDGALQQEAVAWTGTTLNLAAGPNAPPSASNVTYHLVVTKDGVPLHLDQGTSFTLPGSTGVVRWSNQGTGSPANPGDVFDLSLFRPGPVLVHEARVIIDGSKG